VRYCAGPLVVIALCKIKYMQHEDFQEKQATKHSRKNKQGNTLAGILLLVAGSVLLLRQFGLDIPHWLFTWPMIPIVVGLFIGTQTNFRDFGWLIVFGVGVFFLVHRELPDYDISRFIIPVVVIAVGLIILLAPRNKKWHYRKETKLATLEAGFATDEGGIKADVLDATSIFGNVKKVIYSKDFKGGEVVSIFGGVEIDLSQADIKGPVVLEIVSFFGGAKLIIPPHWEIRPEATAIFGGVEDKRPRQSITSPDKVLILQGTSIFSGIDIKSY
jgi:predicted membrane protein